METATFRDDPENERYVADVGGDVAAFTVYHLRHEHLYFFPHTVVNDGYTGRGLAKQLVRYALDDVRAKGGKIVPLCPYVASFLAKNPEYDDLVDHQVYDRVAKGPSNT